MTTLRGHDVHLVTLGTGRPIVCLHGGPGLDHTTLRPWLDPLAGQGRSLVYFDQLGNGRSARGVDLGADAIERWADDLEELRDRLGAPRIVVLGHSFGAFVALAHACRHPSGLEALILCSGAPAFDFGAAAAQALAPRATPPQLAALGAVPDARDDEAFGRSFRTLLPLYFHGAPPPAVLAAMDGVHYSAAAYLAGLAALPRFDLVRRLADIRSPTLLLAGRHDGFIPPAQGAERMARGIRGARLELFEASGHFPFAEEPERFVAVVRDFLGHGLPV